MRILGLQVDSFGALAPGSYLEAGRDAGRPGGIHLLSGHDEGERLLILAVRYALFGDVPASSRGLTASAALQLDFEVDGEAFRVRRSPPKSGLTARKGKDALLWSQPLSKLSAKDGELLKRGRSDVDGFVRELLCIDADSFCRALVLPLREVSRVLGQSGPLSSFVEEAVDAGPALLLENELESALGVIEAEADALQAERREALARATDVVEPGRVTPLGLEDFEHHSDLLASRLQDLQLSLAELREGEDSVSSLLATAKERQERLDKLDAVKRELQDIESREPEFKALREELDRAGRAADFAPREAILSDKTLLRELDKVNRTKEKAERAREVAATEDAAAREAHESSRAKEPELAVLRKDLEGLEEFETVGRVLTEAQAEAATAALRASEKAALLKEQQGLHDAASRRLEKLRAARDQALSRVGEDDAVRIEGLRADVDASKLVLEQATRLAELIEARKEATKNHATGKIRLDRLRGERERLERDLEHAAQHSADSHEVATSEARIAEIGVEARRISEEADDQLDQVTLLGREVLQLRRHLGTKAYTELRRLAADAKLAEGALEEAGSPAETLARCETKWREQVEVEARLALDLDATLLEAEGAAADAETSSALVAELGERLPEHLRKPGALATERSRLADAIEQSEKTMARAETEARLAAEKLAERDRVVSYCAEQVDEVQARVDDAMGAMLKELAAIGFASVSDYQAAARTKGACKKLQSRIKAHEEELSRVREQYQSVRGDTDVPVLRETDRKKWEKAEWERRQAERTERLQAERVRRDRDILEALQVQLSSCVAEAEGDERAVTGDVQALSSVSRAVNTATARLVALRDQHSAAATLADIAGGRRGKGQSFAACFKAAATEETVLRAASWTRWLSCGEFDLKRDEQVRGALALDLREIHGRRLQTLGELHGERRFLATLALCLGLRDAALACRGERTPETLFVGGGLEDMPPEQQAAAQGMLDRLAAVGRSVTLFHDDSGHSLAGRGEATPLLLKQEAASKES